MAFPHNQTKGLVFGMRAVTSHCVKSPNRHNAVAVKKTPGTEIPVPVHCAFHFMYLTIGLGNFSTVADSHPARLLLCSRRNKAALAFGTVLGVALALP